MNTGTLPKPYHAHAGGEARQRAGPPSSLGSRLYEPLHFAHPSLPRLGVRQSTRDVQRCAGLPTAFAGLRRIKKRGEGRGRRRPHSTLLLKHVRLCDSKARRNWERAGAPAASSSPPHRWGPMGSASHCTNACLREGRRRSAARAAREISSLGRYVTILSIHAPAPFDCSARSARPRARCPRGAAVLAPSRE